MTPKPLVSILIPAYNGAPWLAQTLRSALAQTWDHKEIIVVDDGSTDGTLAVARGFESAGVTVVSQANSGAAAARNKAFSLSRGDYLQWLDADDLLAPDKIERQLEAARPSRPLELLSSAFGEFYANPAFARFHRTALWQSLTPVDFLLVKFNCNSWLNPGAWLVSRTLTERAGLWDTRLSLDDDGEYFTRLVAHSTGVRFAPGARMYYRRGNVSSLSRSVSDRAYESLMLSLQLCSEHLLGLENSPRTRQACVRLLQNWVDRSDCFLPDQPERFERAQAAAAGLGGTLSAYRLDWEYRPAKLLFGWKGVRRLRKSWSDTKLNVMLRLDQIRAREAR